MPQPVTAIISQTEKLAAMARLHTGDVNEASLLVGKVISRAFRRFDHVEPDAVIHDALRRDLDALLNQRYVS